MHTLKPSSNKKWKVVFASPDLQYTIEDSLEKPVAMQMVNFLNGGYGHKFNNKMINPTVNVYGNIGDADKI